VPVLLLDTGLPENAPEDRGITDTLYGGGDTYRLKQEIVLGIAGLRIVQALGFQIASYHLNEGHAALLALDLVRRYPRPPDTVAPGEFGYDVARVRSACIFTTHTPVETGHDRFSYVLFEHLLSGYIDTAQLRLLGGSADLNMTLLALNLSGYVNGVAVRHAQTTLEMFPGYDIHSVTNGVHVPTWAHPAFAALFNRFSHDWGNDPEVLVRFDQLPDAAVWEAHRQAKEHLLALVAARTGMQLDPELPILGFARRMTAYKRPDLLFADLKRLRAIHSRYPFQVVLGGKAHPHDEPGRELIRRLHQLIATLAPGLRMVFLPNYDLEIAPTLVAGADIWLNTPSPPLEASGTSGMKAAINGVLNVSVLDGWWLEACIDGATGWAIGEDQGVAQASKALYDKLEHTVLPLYYNDRGRWIWMMKQSVSKIASYFNSHRMMRRYAAEAYIHHRSTARVGPGGNHLIQP
jgi:starch phosphorylase